MSAAKIKRQVPRFALDPTESAYSLGMGLTKFNEVVAPHIRVIRKGKLRLYPVTELQRWAEENAERVFRDAA